MDNIIFPLKLWKLSKSRFFRASMHRTSLEWAYMKVIFESCGENGFNEFV